MEQYQLDLLLVNPGGRKRAFQSLGAELAAVEPPVWAGMLAEFVRKRGLTVEILDTDAEGLTPEAAADLAAARRPRLTTVIVYGHNPSASTQVMPAARLMVAALKKVAPALPVLLLGGHVAALPERTAREEQADYVCGGEGPYTLLDLIGFLKEGHPALKAVRDLGYLREGAFMLNPPAPLVMDLDREMPGLAWDLLPMEKYRAHNWHCFGDLQRQPYAALYTSLGCPFHCSFCCIQAPFKRGEQASGYKTSVNSYRRLSPEGVIAQLDLLVKNYGVRNIKFSDELFVLDQKQVCRICELIIDRGYRLNIWAYTRVDTLKEAMLPLLKQAGINWLAVGIEAANERVLSDARKGYVVRDLMRKIKAIQAHGINICGNYIFGLPEDDLGSMEETLNLALKINAEWANFYCAMAYPGSALYRRAMEAGWPLPESWAGYSQYAVDTLPLPTKYLTGPEVLRFRDQAFQTYFTHPAYLKMIRDKFGVPVVEHLRAMTEQKIERKWI